MSDMILQCEENFLTLSAYKEIDMKRKGIVGLGLTLLLCGSICGCKMRRELEVTLDNELVTEEFTGSLEVNYVRRKDIDLESILNVFLGESEETAEQYIPPYSKEQEGYYEKDGCELTYVVGKVCEYIDLSEGGIGLCYQAACDPRSYWYVHGAVGGWLRDFYPLEDLDSCSKEEVIEACQPYVQAYGYATDIEVNVYAMTLETLEDAWSEWKGHAPDPDYEVPGIDAIRKAGKTEGSEKAYELQLQRQNAVCQNQKWQKEDEAFLMIYRSCIDGKTVHGSSSQLKLIYVPALDKVVYASGQYILETMDTKEQYENLIDREKAVSEAALALNAPQELLEVESIELEYYVAPTVGSAENGEALIPCWTIEYKKTDALLNERLSRTVNGTILINAVDGQAIFY